MVVAVSLLCSVLARGAAIAGVGRDVRRTSVQDKNRSRRVCLYSVRAASVKYIVPPFYSMFLKSLNLGLNRIMNL